VCFESDARPPPIPADLVPRGAGSVPYASGADEGIPREDVDAFDALLADGGVPHELASVGAIAAPRA
jgi:hypothetical protein